MTKFKRLAFVSFLITNGISLATALLCLEKIHSVLQFFTVVLTLDAVIIGLVLGFGGAAVGLIWSLDADADESFTHWFKHFFIKELLGD